MRLRFRKSGVPHLTAMIIGAVVGIVTFTAWRLWAIQNTHINNKNPGISVNAPKDIPEQPLPTNTEDEEVPSPIISSPVPKSASGVPLNPQPTDTKIDTNKIVFAANSGISESTKQEIRSRIAEPMLYYHEAVLHISMKEIFIEKSKNVMSNEDARYILSYSYENDPHGSGMGFIFGYGNIVEYWMPLLCDHGGCREYPDIYKNKYPDNYSAYSACQAAKDDKEKLNSLPQRCLRP